MNLKLFLDQAIQQALADAGASNSPAVIKYSQRPEFGHYQANGVMGAAKILGQKPRDLAATIIAALDLPAADKVEIAGPGFINIHLSAEFIANSLTKLRADTHLGVEPRPAETIVIDYSAPNLAKEMHIGHLRSTSIGDAAARVLEYQGHRVVRANHVGDWGAQFGSLLAYMDQLDAQGVALGSELKDLEKFYMAASSLFKSDPVFAARAREYVVRLQSGDERCRALWQQFINESINHCQAVYDRLNISLSRADIMAESAYNDALPVVLEELSQLGMIAESDGAKCVFLDEFTGKDGTPFPAIVQKSDGGYPYMASDIAAVRYRSQTLQVNRALYFVDARQRLHLAQLFAVARKANYIQPGQDFRHLPFGVILKEDGKPFKTRDGADVKLAGVIDEAISRAYDLVTSKNPELDITQREDIARVVGVGAIKYAELSKNRLTDYVFDWDTMLSFEGNTAPYLQYAYTRIRSVFRRAGIDASTLQGEILISEPLEMQLGLKLLQFSETIDAVTEDYQANLLCNYLYELAGLFMGFYEACPILKAEPQITASRLLLADLTARILQQGLQLLGIDTVEQM
ncbi:MAG: arginine--tRNA ligase [Pseudomonadales bacterium]|nr:arginine--tRNA ligase [Pseudomonadales bacterium]MDP4875898.1 arginine--tRNA ligase [Pseudomonadales bacterium]